MNATIHHGNCLDVLRGMPDNSVDAIVTDPPYGLSNTSPDKVAETIVRWASGDREYVPSGKGFMGAEWDAFVPPPAVWDECYRVLKPGGHAAIFAGSRTYDLMTLAVRLANFEIRDNVAWLYGVGFPKSQNVEKKTGDPAHAGLGTALKPAFEPIILARKPFPGTVAANVVEWGTGAINVDACRIPATDSQLAEKYASVQNAPARENSVYGKDRRDRAGSAPHSKGRFPANVALDRETAGLLNQQSGVTKSKATNRGIMQRYDIDETAKRPKPGTDTFRGHDDEGGASRFFKVVEADTPFKYCAKAPKKERPSYTDENGDTVQHSTVKPLSLMKWLSRLLCPPGGTILDPFAGSGTTLEAATLEGFQSIGIEAHAPYIPLIQARLDRVDAKEAA